MKNLFVFLITLSGFPAFSQTVKGFYVDGFSTILGDAQKEDSLLRFAENNGFNYLTLYQMHIVNANTPLTNTASAQVFADFVEKAKTQYSIAEIGVAVENFNAVNSVYHVYNEQHPANQKIDVYNLEFEFWVPSSVEPGGYYCETYLQPNGYSCDTAGGFAFHKRILTQIDSLAATDGSASEAYFGWFNEGQGAEIVQTGVDRVLISTYLESADYSAAYQYNYIDTRLQSLASAGETVKVIGLYSAEPDFMQDWVTVNPYFQPYTDLVNSLLTETAPWENFIQPEGIQWFAYTDMPKKNMDLGIAEQEEETLRIVPNPANGSFSVSQSGQLSVYDLAGNEVFATEVTSGAIVSPRLSPGMYVVRMDRVKGRLVIF